MLNRRILRTKALQCLYAYYKAKEANYNLALDYITDQYLPDLNSMEPVDRSELAAKKKASLKTFQFNFKHDSFAKLKDSPVDTEAIARDAFLDYEKQNETDYRHYKSNMIRDVNQIYQLYIWMMMIPDELIEIIQDDPTGKLAIRNTNLLDNQIIEFIRSNGKYKEYLAKNKIGWENERDLMYNWFKKVVMKDADYLNYLKEDLAGKDRFTADKRIILHLYKDLLFKNEAFNDFMESEDLNWTEDKHVLRSMILKTFKKLEPGDTGIELASLSNNWEEDKNFFEELFSITVKKDKEFDNLIAEKSKNWDIDRMAILDKIILKMAIGEMIHFPSIPVKVTINEYIELSKNFSTPKSKKFVNGILDVLSEELIQQGTIKKSGRGLIDNK